MKAFVVVGLMIASCAAFAELDVIPTAVWNSKMGNVYSTGGAFADINRDGKLDLVVSDGNDMGRGRLCVFLNDGTGKFSQTPDWQSDDVDYCGHISVADIDGDGYPDVAVSVYLGAGRFSTPGRIKIYKNINGTLEKMPSWVSKSNMFTFSCAFGDANCDGRPDLAVACGESYNEKPDRVKIFINHGGTLADTAEIVSQDSGYCMDVLWEDIDGDGAQDLVCTYERGPDRIYFNRNGKISTSAEWVSDEISFGNSIASGDINGDGLPDLVFSENIQLGGDGLVRVFLNTPGGMPRVPAYTVGTPAYYSAVSLTDLNADGKPELLVGSWGNPTIGIVDAPLEIYENKNGTYSSSADIVTVSKGISEALCFADLKSKALKQASEIFFERESGLNSFKLAHRPVERIISVSSKSASAPATVYFLDRESGNISFGEDAFKYGEITVEYEYSDRPDIAYTNWNKSGNYIFENSLPLTVPADHSVGEISVVPVPGKDDFRVKSEHLTGSFKISVVDQTGTIVMTDSVTIGEDHEFGLNLRSVASGTYFLKIEGSGKSQTVKFAIKK